VQTSSMTGSRLLADNALPSAPLVPNHAGFTGIGCRPGSRAGSSLFGLVAAGLPPIAADAAVAGRPISRPQAEERRPGSQAAGRRHAPVGTTCFDSERCTQLADPLGRRLKVKLLGVRGIRSSSAAEPFCACEIEGKPNTKVYIFGNRAAELGGFSDGDALKFTLRCQDASREHVLGQVSLDSAEVVGGFEGELQLTQSGRGGSAFLKVSIETAHAKEDDVGVRMAADVRAVGGIHRKGLSASASAPALSGAAGFSDRRSGQPWAPPIRSGSRGSGMPRLSQDRRCNPFVTSWRPSASQSSSLFADGRVPSRGEADGCRLRGAVPCGAEGKGSALPHAATTKISGRPSSVGGKMLDIDSETQIPEDLFHQMLDRATEVRSRGQHVLLRRPRSQGAPQQLVHQALAPKLARCKLPGGQRGTSKPMLPIAFTRAAPASGRPRPRVGTACSRRPPSSLGPLPEQGDVRVINL